MLLLADIDLGDLVVAMIVFFFLFLAIWIFIAVFADIFSRRDLTGWGKAGWTLLIFILPLFGVLIYLIARPSEPVGRSTAGGYEEPVRPPGDAAPRT